MAPDHAAPGTAVPATAALPITAPAGTLRLVRLRLYLALVAVAVLPTGFGLAALWILDRGSAGLQPAHLVLLAGLGALVLALVGWMTRQILRPAAALEASQAELHRAFRQVREYALVDGLTGLGNHRAFQEEFVSLLDQAHRYRHDLSLVLLDLDEFKQVNDSQGHAVGDALLSEVGRLLRQQVRLADRAFRIGGDEFAILLPHTGATGAAQLARRVLASGLEVRPAAAYPRPISFSAGVASSPAHATTREQLRLLADSAMYRGKRAGRTTVTVADPELDAEHVDEQKRARLADAVVHVIEHRLLLPAYQPIVDLRTGAVTGFEGLVRPLPDTEFTNPGALFTAAEIGGRVAELDVACLGTVLAGARAIPGARSISVNISPRTLETPEFGAARLLHMLRSNGIPAARVILEITERDVIHDLPRVLAALAACRAAGMRIAADDVGAGNAGLRLLSQFRFDVVKIDLSLVQAGTGHETVRSVLGTLVDLARRWGALVVAEGVETAAQLALTRDLGMDAAQGYLLGRPGEDVALDRVDLDALLQPPTDPFARLGLTGFRIETVAGVREARATGSRR